jgi:outer membrane protein TolC
MTASLLRRTRAPTVIGGLGLLLSGCVTFQDGMGTVQMIARAELQKDAVKIETEADALAARTMVEDLLKLPLTSERAVQIALLNNRGLQAAYNELGLSEAQLVQASLPPNPKISLARLGGSLELEIERQILFNILALATLPARREIAADRFRAAQFRAAEATLRLAADTRRQFYRAVAANQLVSFLTQARASAEAASELATKLGETGAINKLRQAREHAFYQETSAQLAKARLQQRIERERFIRLMGLWGRDIEFKLPASLPPLPSRVRTARDIEQQALRRRVDLQVARIELEALAKSLGLTQATRFVNDLELAAANSYERAKGVEEEHGRATLEKEKVYKRGFEIEFEIPIFDFGQARVAQAEQTYMQAANRFAEKAVNIRSEVREAYQTYRGTYDIARLYQSQVLPLRKIIQDEQLLQYNAMIADVTQLITDARARILSNAQAIEARRDFWIANTDLHVALVGGSLSGGAGSASTMPAAAGGGEPAH